MVACSKDFSDYKGGSGGTSGSAAGSGGTAMSASGGAGGATGASGGTTGGMVASGGTTGGSGGVSAGSGGMTGSGGMSGGTGGTTPDGGMADSGMGGGPDGCDACLASMCGAQFTAVMGDPKALTLATCSKGVCTGACCICGVMACSAENWSMGPCGEETLDAAGLPGVAYGLDAVPVTDNCIDGGYRVRSRQRTRGLHGRHVRGQVPCAARVPVARNRRRRHHRGRSASNGRAPAGTH